MSFRAGSVEPDESFSPPLVRDNPELGNKSPYATDDPTSSSSSSGGPDTDMNRDNCERVLEQWRLIRLADKNKPKKKKIYPYHAVYTAPLGRNYSKFYEAFRQGLRSPPTNQNIAPTVPAKRSATSSDHPAKRLRQENVASLQPAGQDQARTTPAKRAATTNIEPASKRSKVVTLRHPARDENGRIPTQVPAAPIPKASSGPKPKGVASSLQVASESPVTPRPRSEAKDQPSRRKGVGLYAGNWEYATDEEKVPEYLSVVQNTAGSEGRTTRRAYAKLTSRAPAGDSSNYVDLSPGNEVRKSGRARNAVDYSRLSRSENNAHEIATPRQNDEDLNLPAEGNSSNSSASSTSNRSTSMADHPSRSTSTSTAVNTEQPERPNLSWNSIVYGILASAGKPLTFHELVARIKERYPYFKNSSQVSILKSGPKNPLYFHEAFCKGDIVNGMQTWTLKPGEFVDKKTGEVMTPQPRPPGSSSRPADQAREVEDDSPSKSTSKPSPASNPRSSNPRFGREILNSPEIPDSQEIKASTPAPQETDIPVATEQPLYSEETTEVQEIASTADDTPMNAAVATNLPDQSSQPRYPWATTSFNPINATPARLFTAASATFHSVQNSIRATDDAVSATAAQSSSTAQGQQPSAASFSSSVGDREQNGNSTTPQTASTSLPLAHAVSTATAPTTTGDRPATPQSASTPSVSSLPVTSIPCTQLDGFLPDGKAGAKEITHKQSQGWE